MIAVLVVAAWMAVAVASALVYGRIVARADHDRRMTQLVRESRVPTGPVSTRPRS